MFENQILNYVVMIILGLIIGSFLNVIILRFDELKTIWLERSHCTKCQKTLAWYDLVPFFSFVFLSGKCRYCKANISLQYPLVEAFTALLFALLFWKFGLSWVLLPWLIISSLLIVMFVYDILHLLISDGLIVTALIVWIIWLIIGQFIFNFDLSILNYLYGGLALGGLLGLLVVISKEKWMGAGDIGLGFLLGALIGWPNVLVGTFAAFLLGSLVGVFLILIKKKGPKAQIAFAPFLILGMFTALFWGEKIIYWYTNLIW